MRAIRIEIVLPSWKPFTIEAGGMKRTEFTTREGSVMLLELTVAFIVMMWLVLSGVLQIKD